MIRTIALSAAVALYLIAPAAADLPGAPEPVRGGLLDDRDSTIEGRWSVEMLHGGAEEDAPTTEELIINSASPTGWQGGFLGAPFGEGRMRKVGSSFVFFTQTSDGTGPIYHSGRITGGRITGQSYFTQRQELLPWQGRKIELED